MARTVDIIYADLVATKEADERLNALSSTSKVALWRLWLWIIAYASFVLETLFDSHTAENDEILNTQKPHRKNWYKTASLAFQYGYNLIPDTDIFINGNSTDEEIEASKIIKYAAVTEGESKSLLIIKVATENSDGELSPIESAQETAFNAYIDEIADAGVDYNIINYLPDILRLNLIIYYDPLLLTADGVSIQTGLKPVDIALTEFQKQLPFNGELILAYLIDKLQKTTGVVIPHLVNASSSWINENGTDYGNFEFFSVRKIPTSGYFKLENFLGIQYIAS